MAAPIVVLTGPPGAGKTTVARRVARSFEPAIHLVGDEFFRVIATGYLPPWRPESHPQNQTVQSAVTAAALRYALGGYTVVLDWIVGPWALPQLVDETGNTGVPLHYVVLRPDEATALARATARAAPELVDPEPIAKMYDAFRDLGGYEHHVLDSTGATTDETVAAVLDAIAAGDHLLVSGEEGVGVSDPKVRSTEIVRLDYFYDRFRARIEGLTDEEHLWEPVPGFTTIAWRLAHIGDGLREERNWRWLGREPEQRDADSRYSTTAAGAIAYVEDSWARWQSLVGSLTPDELWEPIGAVGGHYGGSERIELVLHIADELIHHAAEVGVMRDLYAATRAVGGN